MTFRRAGPISINSQSKIRKNRLQQGNRDFFPELTEPKSCSFSFFGMFRPFVEAEGHTSYVWVFRGLLINPNCQNVTRATEITQEFNKIYLTVCHNLNFVESNISAHNQGSKKYSTLIRNSLYCLP